MRPFFVLIFGVLSAFCGVPRSLAAEELWRTMFRELLERKYYDTAEEYLQSRMRSPHRPDALEAECDFHLGTLHLDALQRGGAPLGFDVHLLRARTHFQRFLETSPDHCHAYRATAGLGNVALEIARRSLRHAAHEGRSDGDRETLRREAQRELELAGTYFEKAERIAYAHAKAMQLDPTVGDDPARVLKRETLYARVLESRIQIAVTSYERARACDPQTPQFDEAIKHSARQFHDLAVKYHNYAGSLTAKLYEAKALHAVKSDGESKKIVQELLFLPETSPVFRPIVLEALQLFLEINLAEDDEASLAESLRRIDRWTDSTPPAERSEATCAAIHLLAGKTYLRYSEGKKGREAERAAERALFHFRAVAPETEEFVRAKEILERLDAETLVTKNPRNPSVGEGGGATEASHGQNDGPRDITEIKRDAERLYLEFVRPGRGFDESGDENEADAGRAAEVLALFRDLLAQPESFRPEQRNEMRLKLAGIFWTLERWEETCVIGGFLAHNYPDTSFGRQGAEFLIKGLRKICLRERAAGRDASGVKAKIIAASEFIASRWEDTPLGHESISIRIETELDDGSPENAKKFIAALPEGSSRRASAELLLGRVLGDALLKMQDETDVPGSPNRREVPESYEEVRRILEKGLAVKERDIRSGKPVDEAVVFSAFLLARLHAIRRERDKALDILQHPVYGPLFHLVRTDADNKSNVDDESDSGDENAPSQRGGVAFGHCDVSSWPVDFRISVLLFSLRLFVDSDSDSDFDSLMPPLSQVESLVTEERPDAQSRLSHLYVLIGRRMHRRVQTLRQTATQEELRDAQAGFESFLERVRLRDGPGSEESLLWVANMFYESGKARTAVDASAIATHSESENPDFEKSEAVYRTILAENPGDTAIRYRLALVLRERGEAEKAYQIMLELLAESEHRLDVQCEAARTLQYRGRENAAFYSKAIVGDEKRADGTFLIWGWNGIIARVSRNFAKFPQAYYEAYYNKALTRVLLARSLSADKAATMLQGAKNDIQRLRRLRPQVGHTPWSEQFDALLELIAREETKNVP